MNFSVIELAVDNVTYTFVPYDRGANGAFVYRQNDVSVHAPRAVVSTSVNDTSSDRMTVQVNTPNVYTDPDTQLEMTHGTDLVKTELRFLAVTSQQDRAVQIDKHIALLQELRDVIETRTVIYS